MSQQDHENDVFLWENPLWANLSNDNSDNSGSDKMNAPAPEAGAEKGKKRERAAVKKGKGKLDQQAKEGGETSNHETHIWTERERRKKMRTMFSNLHSLLPQLPAKADKSSIVDEAVSYIKTLQVTLQRLQKQKLEGLKLGGTKVKSLTLEPSVAATSRLAMLSTRESFMADQVSSFNNNINNNSTMAITNTPSHLLTAIQTYSAPNVALNLCGDNAQITVYTPKKPGTFTTICCVLEKHKMEVISAHILSDANVSFYMILARLGKGTAEELSGIMTMEEIYQQATREMVAWLTS